MEKLIDAATEKQLKEKFNREMKEDVKVTLFISDTVQPGNEQQAEINGFARQLLSEFSSIEPRIKFEEKETTSKEAKKMNISTSPSLVIGADRGYEIIYNGAPLGHEATGFIETLIMVSGGESGLSESSLSMLKTIEKHILIQVFVTPQCPHCPQAVTLANRLAVAAKGKITAECVEAVENPGLAQKYNVSSVPQQVINGDKDSITIGAQREEEFVMQAVKYGNPGKFDKIKEENEKRKKEKEKLPDNPEGLIHITDGNFEEASQKYKNLVVDCWAEWCGPCKMITPVLEELAAENRGKIVFGKLNVDENPKTAGENNIMSIPALLVFSGGSKKGDIIGAHPKEEIKKQLDDFFNL